MRDDVLLAISDVSNGSMSKAVDDDTRLRNRRDFLRGVGISVDQVVLVHLLYEGEDYRRYYTVGNEQAGDGIINRSSITADALFTRSKNLALLLPVADCVGAVLYDPISQVLGLGHLGRHNLLQQGGTGMVQYMVEEFGSDPNLLQIWLSPAAGREHYPLHDFDNRSLHEVATEQLLAGGVDSNNISVDARDTAAESSFFSHSEFLKGNRMIDGRQAVVAMMKL